MAEERQPAFACGDKLVVAAPAHSGLPSGASAIVARCSLDRGTSPFSRESTPGESAEGGSSAGWVYDITLTGGGKMGSDVQYVRGVPEAWLRSSGRLSMAKSCAPVPFGTFALSSSRLVIPLFQRRYCWDFCHWERLWHDVLSASVVVPHTLGRIVFTHERRLADPSSAIVLVDGQQRCTTIFLLLCALRDAAQDVLPHDLASPIITAVERVLLPRKRRLQHGSLAGNGRDNVASLTRNTGSRPSITGDLGKGLASVDGSADVRLVPSRRDQLPFFSIVCRVPFDTEGCRTARTMHKCYEFFRDKAMALLHDTECVCDSDPTLLVGENCGNLSNVRDYNSGSSRDEAVGEPANAPLGKAGARALSAMVTRCLTNVKVVAFELQDGVALNNM